MTLATGSSWAPLNTRCFIVFISLLLVVNKVIRECVYPKQIGVWVLIGTAQYQVFHPFISTCG